MAFDVFELYGSNLNKLKITQAFRNLITGLFHQAGSVTEGQIFITNWVRYDQNSNFAVCTYKI